MLNNSILVDTRYVNGGNEVKQMYNYMAMEELKYEAKSGADKLYNELLNKKIIGSLANGLKFRGLLVSFNDQNIVVESSLRNRVLLRLNAVNHVCEVV